MVDDDPEVLAMMVDALKQEGYSPRFTSDSRDASELLTIAAFDIVVSEISMPHLSGFQLLETAKRLNTDTQVVLVTGESMREVAFEALKRGASGFIEKPFRSEQLLALVREAVWRWRLKKQGGTQDAVQE